MPVRARPAQRAASSTLMMAMTAPTQTGPMTCPTRCRASSRKLAAANHYPAIDVQASVSRVMNAVVDKEHKAAAQALRKILAKYAEVELLVQIGEYKKGADAEADFALGHIQAVNDFLRQGLEEKSSFEETLAALKKVVL